MSEEAQHKGWIKEKNLVNRPHRTQNQPQILVIPLNQKQLG